MLRKKDNKNMGRSNIGWLKSIFHFSFAEYRNPANMNFGVLRVLNDDLIKAGKGFNLHPHRDMEIISYVVDVLECPSLSATFLRGIPLANNIVALVCLRPW